MTESNPTRRKTRRNPGAIGDLAQIAILAAVAVWGWQQVKAKALPGQ